MDAPSRTLPNTGRHVELLRRSAPPTTRTSGGTRKIVTSCGMTSQHQNPISPPTIIRPKDPTKPLPMPERVHLDLEKRPQTPPANPRTYVVVPVMPMIAVWRLEENAAP